MPMGGMLPYEGEEVDETDVRRAMEILEVQRLLSAQGRPARYPRGFWSSPAARVAQARLNMQTLEQGRMLTGAEVTGGQFPGPANAMAQPPTGFGLAEEEQARRQRLGGRIPGQ